MSSFKLATAAALSFASLLIASGRASADVNLVAPGVAGSVTNVTVGSDVYDVTFVGNVSHLSWASQLDFHTEAEAEAAVAAVAAELNAAGGVTAVRFTTTSSTFDFTEGQLWYAADTTTLYGETLIRSAGTWKVAFPFPGGSTAPLNGAFPLALDFTLVNSSPWVDLGEGTAGVSGLPELAGTGTLVDGDPVTLSLSNAKPNSMAALLIGLSLLDAPFKGGTLVPDPLLIVTVPTDGAGTIAVPFQFASGVPAGAGFYFQYWIQDASATLGLSASNGLLGIAQ
ncbi:MAG: hypothetical protein H6825_11055 [Planctomycetes bacterium]|nr:hypothetical protein [Planctomycetota bacterium]